MGDQLTERQFSADQRKMMADKGMAMPDGSFPIETMADLMNAIHAVGRAANPEAAKRHIIKRAKALGATDKLPADWQGSTKEGEEAHLTEAVERVSLVEGSQGKEWDIKVISPGVSKNGVLYEPAVLRAAAPLYEGARSYVDHGTGSRSFRDRAGIVRSPVYESRDGEEGLWARLTVTNPAVRAQLLESYEAGEEIGFSHDVIARAEPVTHQGRRVRKAKAIEAVNSVDIVDRPSAGGKAVRLVAGEEIEDVEMDPTEIKDAVSASIKEAMAEASSALTSGLAAALREALGPVKGAESGQAGGTGDGTAATVKTALDAASEPAALTEATKAAREALAAATKERQRGELARQLEATKLTEIGKAHARKEFEDAISRRALEDEEIREIVKRIVEYEAVLTQPTADAELGRMAGNAVVYAGQTAREKFVKDLDAFYAPAGEKLDEGVKPFRSLRHAYSVFTGKWDVDYEEMLEDFAPRGGYRSGRDSARIQESITTASWGEINADVMYQRLIKAYRSAPWYDQWRLVVSDIENVPDFRTRHWMRFGGYGDLPTVPEGGTYTTTTSPTDEEVTYSLSKRGYLDDITMETMANDQVGVVRRIPSEFGRAAARTLFKFVMDLVTTSNPTMAYDSTTLYHANHNNTGTTALSVAGLWSTQQAMYDQTGYGQTSEILGQRLGIKTIIIPNELAARASRIVNPSDAYTFALSSTPDADTSIDPQQFKGSGIQAIVYHQLTDATDWWAVADPNEVETFVIGFFQGQQEPELVVQDQPQNGSNFTADKTTWKVRHIYGGTVADHRPFYRQVVAG